MKKTLLTLAILSSIMVLDCLGYCTNPVPVKPRSSAIPMGTLRTGPTVNIPTPSNTVIGFQDANLKELIKKSIGVTSNDITVNDCLKLTMLKITNDVKSLEGIQYCSNLSIINMEAYSAINDFKPLTALTKLSGFTCNFCKLDNNIEWLSDMTNLKYLDLSLNDIVDIGPIKNLINLGFLNIAVNRISDISVLKNLSKITVLKMYSNNISDIEPLLPMAEEAYKKALHLYVEMIFNPLSDYSKNTIIPKLRQLNAEVGY